MVRAGRRQCDELFHTCNSVNLPAARIMPGYSKTQFCAIKTQFGRQVRWLNQFAGYPLSDNQRMALVYLRNNPQMTNSEYRRLNNVTDTIQATRELKKLVDVGLIEMHASRRWATYSHSREIASPPAGERELKVLRHVREKGSISSGECQRLLGITAPQAWYLLWRMRQSGFLAKIGERRWTRYVLS